MTKPTKSVMIIGGGLGGLLLAQLLSNSDMKVTVYERDDHNKSRFQGYQIGLNSDGIRCLEAIKHKIPELKPYLENNCNIRTFLVTDQSLNPLGKKPGDNCLVNRRVLRDMLARNIHIEWGKKFVRYEESGGSVTAYFKDGTSATADILVGADGANSAVRQQRTSQIVMDSVLITNIGGTTSQPENLAERIPQLYPYLQDTMVRILGSGGNALMAFLYTDNDGGKKIAWGLVHGGAMNDIYPADDKEKTKQMMVERVKQYLNDDAAYLIESTDPSTWICNVNSRTSRRLCPNPLGDTTRVTLLGDSAHVMTTHRGLGANTAFQDATDLAAALVSENSLDAVAQYEAVMIKRGFEAVDASLSATKSMTTPSLFGWLVKNFMWIAYKIM